MIESWKQSVFVAAAVMIALAIGVGLQVWSLKGAPEEAPPYTAIASGSPAAMVAVPASCPAQSSAIANKAFRPAVGDGPVYMTLGPRTVVGQQVLNYYPSVLR